ncbi:MAG: dephospho-CoA kinase [Ignavibacteria bacterium]|nr:dephospho-CoA kinase [Ignavibacteria bacterium]
MKKKILIGITGGIGSGKSIVGKKLVQMGFKVLNADLIAKELYKTDKNLARAIVREFGEDILTYKNRINLSKLKDIIFTSRRNYLKINSIVHPVVISNLLSRFKRIKSSIIFIEAALIFESGFDKLLDYVLMVYSDKENRIKRIMERNGVKREEVEKIIKMQMDDRKKTERSDFILVNNKSCEFITKQVEFLGKFFRTL